jgi:hypothetical protein
MTAVSRNWAIFLRKGMSAFHFGLRLDGARRTNRESLRFADGEGSSLWQHAWSTAPGHVVEKVR